MLIVGLLSGSPGSALNANTLKSEDSTNTKSCVIVFPVATAGAPVSFAPLIASTTGAGVDIQ